MPSTGAGARQHDDTAHQTRPRSHARARPLRIKPAAFSCASAAPVTSAKPQQQRPARCLCLGLIHRHCELVTCDYNMAFDQRRAVIGGEISGSGIVIFLLGCNPRSGLFRFCTFADASGHFSTRSPLRTGNSPLFTFRVVFRSSDRPGDQGCWTGRGHMPMCRIQSLTNNC